MKKPKNGCVKIFLYLVLLSLAVAAYSLLWIPAIGVLIYFIVSKKYADTRIRNIAISTAVIVTSLIVFVWLGNSQKLTSVNAVWSAAEYDISDSASVAFFPTPSNAKIKTIVLNDNDIAVMKQEGTSAVVTFQKTGTASLSFQVDGINTPPKTITVKDKAAEEAAAKKAEEERIAAEKAEQERIAAEQAEQERIAAEQAEQERVAAEQAEQERIAAEQAAAAQTAQAAAAQADPIPKEQMVWIPATGKKYHSHASCSNMKNPRQVTISEAESLGFTPCKKCY